MSTMAEWESRCMAAHEAEVVRGLHDGECEYGRRLKHSRLMLCNCSKRRRERAGFTVPPREDLYFPPPDCPRCNGHLHHDGDSWCCYECSLCWDSNGSGSSCCFTDDHGNLGGSKAADDKSLIADAAKGDAMSLEAEMWLAAMRVQAAGARMLGMTSETHRKMAETMDLALEAGATEEQVLAIGHWAEGHEPRTDAGRLAVYASGAR